MTEQQICPSATGETPNSQIIGFIGADGVVANIPTPIPLTDEMRDSIGPQPERIFRLAGPCIQSKCSNWENQACALIGRMREEVDRRQLATEPVGKLPRCAIRSACVWWRQSRAGGLPRLPARDLQPIPVMLPIRLEERCS